MLFRSRDIRGLISQHGGGMIFLARLEMKKSQGLQEKLGKKIRLSLLFRLEHSHLYRRLRFHPCCLLQDINNFFGPFIHFPNFALDNPQCRPSAVLITWQNDLLARYGLSVYSFY